MRRKTVSHRTNRVGHVTLCLLFRLNRSAYRRRRLSLGPLLEWLFGFAARRTHPAQRAYPSISSARSMPARSGAPLTLAEKHAAKYRAPQTQPAAHGSAASSGHYPTIGASGSAAPRRPSAAPEVHTSHQPRRFHSQRPDSNKLHSSMIPAPHPNQKPLPLPHPTGATPYRMMLESVLGADSVNRIKGAGKMTFHVAGDTGGVKSPASQQIVVMNMEKQCETVDVTSRPAFFYHLGDVVYYNGERKEYYSQFYDPYMHYPAPIFAIPGNHDGDAMPDGEPSLVPFVDNFCAPAPRLLPEAGETSRDAMTQPNVYWTLQTPFATFIGLYSNVVEGGHIDDQQMAWFIGELKAAPPDQAVLVSVHHPAYSADSHHSGSRYIAAFLDHCFQESGRVADAVFTGHVHNYQRFTRTFSGRQIPYIVAGAGGYWHLHYMAKQDDGQDIPIPFKMPDGDLVLENACDNRHGFLRMTVTPRFLLGEYWSVPHTHESWRGPAQRVDLFTLDWHKHELVKMKV